MTDSNNPTGISWGQRSDNNGYYMLGLKGAYNNGYSTYSRLAVAWHTGVEIGGNPSYGGTRFFSDSPYVTTTEIMSVGKGDSHVRVVNNLYAKAFYDIDNTAYFLNPSAQGGNSLLTIGDWRQNTSNWSGEVAGKMQYHGNNWYIQYSANTIFRNASAVDTMIMDSSGNMTASGSSRAPIFYDSNDTAYFMDLHSTGNSVVAKGTVHIGQSGHLGIGNISHPKRVIPGAAAAWAGNGNTTGQIVIDLPGTLANYDMLYFEVDVYEYSSKNGTKIIVGGHNWNAGADSGTGNLMWHNVGVKVIGDMDKPIYFGWRNNGSVNKRVMVIGEPASSWSYGTVRVSSVSGADDFYIGAIDYTGDWAVTQSTSSSIFTKSPTTDFNGTGEKTLKTHGRMAAYGYQGNGNVGGTGEASWHPSGIYSNGLNYLYGRIIMNNNYISGCRHIEVGADANEAHILRRNNGNNTEIRTHASGSAGLLVRNGNDQFRFQLYGDGSNYGFLDGIWASWDLRKTTNGALYLNGDTSYYLQPEGNTSANLQGDVVINAYGRGLVGLYSSTRYQHVWSMGAAYRTAADGSGFGNIYGLTYTHTNVGTGTNESIAGLSHQLQHRHNGTLTAAIGSGIWTSGNVTAYSDIAVKRNLEVIPDALNKVCQINGYTYERTDYVKDEEDPNAPDILRQAGVVAQEVEKVLPEVVSGEEGNKAVAYGNMVSILIEAIKELKSEVDDLKEQLKNK